MKLHCVFLLMFTANVIYGQDSSIEMSQLDEELGKDHGGIFKDKRYIHKSPENFTSKHI